MDAQNWSAVVGLLFFVISYLVSKPIKQSLDDVKSSIAEMKSALEAIRNDTANMRSEIELTKRDLKTAFRYVDELKERVKELEDRFHDSISR